MAIARDTLSRTDFADVAQGGRLSPVLPGALLKSEFLDPLGVSRYRLAKDIGVPPQRIGDIVAGKRAITADTDLRLCRYFGLADGFWLRLQAGYDTDMARRRMAGELAHIPRRPFEDAA